MLLRKISSFVTKFKKKIKILFADNLMIWFKKESSYKKDEWERIDIIYQECQALTNLFNFVTS